MSSILTRLRNILMSIVATFRHRGTGTGSGGGGDPITTPPYLASTSLTGDATGIVTHATSAYAITQLDQHDIPFAGPPGPFTWQSSNPAVATINSSGVATCLSAGTTQLTCQVTNTNGAVITSSPPVTLTVSAQVNTTATISPPSATKAVPNTQQFTATVFDQATVPNVIVGATGTWDTSDHSKATIAADGLATAVATTGGTPVSVTFTAGAAVGTAQLAVNAASAVTAVTANYSNTTRGTLSTAPCLFFGGNTYPLVATDQSGAVLSGVGSWTSSDPTNAPIDSTTGVVSPVGITKATFTYKHTSTGLTSTITASVLNGPVTWLKQEPISYLSDSQFRANIKSNVTFVLPSGSTQYAVPAPTGGAGALYTDGINEGLISYDPTRPFMGNPGLTQFFPQNSGAYSILRGSFGAPLGRVWTITATRCDSGFTNAGNGVSPPSASYKYGPYIMRNGLSGRSGSLVTNGTNIDTEVNLLGHLGAGGGQVGGRSEFSIGSVTTEWSNSQWIVDIGLYEIRAGSIMSRRGWRSFIGQHPVTDNKLNASSFGGAMMPGETASRMDTISPFGENMNRTTVVVGGMFKTLGFWGVVDGEAHGDPFGMAGTQPTPTLTGISGGTLTPGDTSKTITLTGTFTDWCYPVFSNPGIVAHFTADGVQNLTITATTITFLVDVTSTAAAGVGTVYVYNAASQVSTATQVVTVGNVVVPGAPTMSDATTVNFNTVTFPYVLNGSGGVADTLPWRYRATGSGNPFVAGGAYTLVSPTLAGSGNAVITLPASGTPYDVQFAESNGGGTSAYSSTVTGTTAAAPALITTNLVLKLSSSAGLDVSTNGASVGSMTDQGTTGAVWQQGTASKKPTLVLNAYGSTPAIRCASASSQNLTTAAPVAALNTADKTLYFIGAVRTDNPGGNQHLLNNFNGNGGASQEGYGIQHSNGTTTVAAIVGSNTVQTTLPYGAVTQASGLHCYTLVLDHTTPSETLYIDGVLQPGGAAAFKAQITAPTPHSIGSQAGSSKFADMDFVLDYEYSGLHTASNVAQNYAYFKSQYPSLP